MVHFQSPYFFALLIFLPMALRRRDGSSWLSGRENQFRPIAVRFASPIPLSSLPTSPKVAEQFYILNGLRFACLLFLAIALARPQTGLRLQEIEASGRDILLSLDTSGSMHALDFRLDGERVERLTALKHVVQEFIEERKGDRIGLVVFGTDVYTQCPLTADTHVLQEFVAGLEIGMVGDGTALGDGIALSVKRLRDIEAQSKVIVLVTDGVKTAGNLEPKTAAEVAAKAGIKIYTIAIGGNKPAPFKVTGIFGEPRIEYRPVELDEKTLKEIADTTGGKYYNAQDTDSLREIYSEISKIEERKEKSQDTMEYDESYLLFAAIALSCFLLHELLASTRYLTIPE